jgi:hypothetical protein
VTEAEFLCFIKSLYVAFPSLFEWVQKNSPDTKATHRTWYKTLGRYSLEECQKVLDSWIDGSRKAFAGFEKDQVALLIKAGVEFDRGQLRRHRSELDIVKDRINDAADQHRKREQYKRQPMIGEIYAKILPLNKKLEKGEITEAEWEAEKNKLIEESKKFDWNSTSQAVPFEVQQPKPKSDFLADLQRIES